MIKLRQLYNEIKISRITPKLVEELIDNLQNLLGLDNFIRIVMGLLIDDYGKKVGWMNEWLESLDQKTLNNLYKDLLNIKNQNQKPIDEIKITKPATSYEVWQLWTRLRNYYYISSIDFNEIGEILENYINKFDELNDRGFQKYDTQQKINMLSQKEKTELYYKLLKYFQKYNLQEIKIQGNITFDQVVKLIRQIMDKIEDNEDIQNKWYSFWEKDASFNYGLESYYKRNPKELSNLYKKLLRFQQENNLQ